MPCISASESTTRRFFLAADGLGLGLAGRFAAAAFLALAFFAARLGAAFLAAALGFAATFFLETFFLEAFFLATFFLLAFLATAFRLTVFLVEGFLPAVVFLVFFAEVFFAAVFLLTAFVLRPLLAAFLAVAFRDGEARLVLAFFFAVRFFPAKRVRLAVARLREVAFLPAIQTPRRFVKTGGIIHRLGADERALIPPRRPWPGQRVSRWGPGATR